MRQFHMSVVERREPVADSFDTHPFEAAWASEAIFFLRVEELSDGGSIDARVQISADGMRWLDEGTAVATVNATGDAFVKVKHFGGWLRLAGTVEGSAEITVQLALKE